jgi:hypothetical protein
MEVSNVGQDTLTTSKREIKDNEKERLTDLLKGGWVLLCCLGFHPMHVRRPSLGLVCDDACRSDRDWALLS